MARNSGSLRMRAKRTFALSALDGADQAMWGIYLPGKTLLNGFQVNLSFLEALTTVAAHHEFSEGVALSFETWLIPIQDPDTPSTYDLQFDRFVPKDSDGETIDLDTNGADANAFWEPGEMNLNLALRLGNQPIRMSHWHKIMTAANSAGWIGQDIEVADNDQVWTPAGVVHVRSNKKVFVSKPAMLVCAVGVPDMDDVVTTLETPLTETQQLLVRFMRASLQGAIMHQIGVAGALASTWWDTASTALQQHLNPDVFEEVAGMFATVSEFQLFGEATIDHTVEGELSLKSISGGR